MKDTFLIEVFFPRELGSVNMAGADACFQQEPILRLADKDPNLGNDIVYGLAFWKALRPQPIAIFNFPAGSSADEFCQADDPA